jgi:hypothetical protein
VKNNLVQVGTITLKQFTLNGRELSVGMYFLHIGRDPCESDKFLNVTYIESQPQVILSAGLCELL